MGGFAGRPRGGDCPSSSVTEQCGKGVSAARRGMNGGASSAVLVPEQSRTKDDHDDEHDFGESVGLP